MLRCAFRNAAALILGTVVAVSAMAQATRADAQAQVSAAVDHVKKVGAVAEEAINFAMAYARDEAARALSERFSPLEQQWATLLGELATLQQARAEAAKDGIATTLQDRMRMLGLLLVVVIVGSGAFAIALTRSVTRPLREAARVAARVAEGDLAVEIRPSGHDEASELLRSLATMTAQLAAMVGAVRESAGSIGTALREIAQGNVDRSSRTERQASSVQETAASLQTLTTMVSQTAAHAETMRDLSVRTATVAEEGGSAMTSVAHTMSLISESSKRIADIIGTIDAIAFQTNILALNAAVQAARAGEQGRGFAVVAGEVRNLAQRVTGAAAEVRTLINASVERVGDGARRVTGLSGTLHELLTGVERVRTPVGEITSASAQQSQNIAQVSHCVRSIEGSTQQNCARVEQVAAAAQRLSGQTQRLSDMVRRFRVA